MSFCPQIAEYAEEDVILDSIYTEEIWGESRRVFLYQSGNFDNVHFAYEGLGGLEGIFSLLRGIHIDEGWYKLLNICIGTNEECGIIDLVSTKDILPLIGEIQLSPNPTNGEIKLKLSEKVSKIGTFQITDLTGKIVNVEGLKRGEYSRYLDLPKGFYSASFQQKGRILWQTKLILLP